MSNQRHFQRNQTPASQQWAPSQTRSSPDFSNQMHQTLVELEQAMKNLHDAVQLLHQSGILPLSSPGSSQNLLAQLAQGLKQIDVQQITSLLQSPFIQRILTDPDFYQLFVPDTGKTPGTQPKFYPQSDDEKQN
ncbi:hypothetical protein CathTA2_1613 [Caldalkalibacillus thermarum TA2.A1]|uniref:Uncharacterized protein n=1 Tax=Caldalkalibacillus thermarum (strain TA2.A1) TaxID=986075 RepID=F5L713_CALTT|nr:hypothetical protein [Caldalkalibacillus thermarum]EGL82848.1 hypothetical protein CathTA2_1613 [Caldalkalibacillus thermarum TA2.A1]QZT32702.1 hypothetical protein HUR95_09920 [Caldalkalibacillus thermarum TA2.A1]